MIQNVPVRERGGILPIPGKQEAIARRVHYIPTNMSKEKILIDETEMQMQTVECSEN